MKRLDLTVLALLSLALLSIGAQNRAPRIVFDSQSKDCGKVTEGEPLKHIFRFTNTGDATLEILKVEPS
jgi:hypothetical protein